MHVSGTAGGLPDRPGVSCAPGGAPGLDAAPPRGPARGTQRGAVERGRDRAPHAEKTVLKPWPQPAWCRPTVRPAWVWRMEALLALYAEPYAPRYPVICVDESPCQRSREVRPPLPRAPGQLLRYDDADRREGTGKLGMGFPPVQGWRHVKVTDRRTAKDCAHGRHELVDVHVPPAALISVVRDNLHTPTPAAVSDALPPGDARRLLRTLDCRETPTHGSWLKMADIALAVVSKPGLDQRLPTQERVRRTTTAGDTQRHAVQATVNGRFTIAKARRKLKGWDPSPPLC
jgi:hypothetical protein